MKNRICLDLGKDTTKGGSVTRKNGSTKLYVSLRYFGKRIEKSTGLTDTQVNRKQVREWLDRIMDKIEDGSFQFAEAFPGATHREKAYFAQREGWMYNPEPQTVLINAYINDWMDRIWASYPSETKKRDYKRIIDAWLIPYFEGKTFYQLTRVEIQQFLAQLKRQKGDKEGQTLSRSRVNNILIPLRAIWNDACDEHHWDLPDPFRNLGRLLPRAIKKRRTVFRFAEWVKLLDHLSPHYRNIAEFMMLTGMIASEVAGLKIDDIEEHVIDVKHSIVLGHEKDNLKTPYRLRRIPITRAIRKCLDKAIGTTDGEHVFAMESGRPFHEGSFRQNIWTKALKDARLDYKVPYTMRHSFAAWSLTISIDPNRLVRLMGHGSKKMVYEVYGDYVEGLENDRFQILNYFGQDFLDPKHNRHPLSQEREWRKSGESRHLRLVK